MVKIQYSGENKAKVDFILETAQHRFGMFGLEKTTMREIADDAGMSKASLYYYFPDKISLFHAVIKKEQDDFFRYLDESCRNIQNPEKMLGEYVNIRNLYFRKFINLSKLRLNAIRELRPVMRDLFEELKARELNFIKQILISGREENYFRSMDEEVVATIFLDALQGIRKSYIGRLDFAGLDAASLDEMDKKMHVFLDIFTHGIAGMPGTGSGKA